MLFYEDLKDVVMVGTSSGGMVLCRAAETARERIARVVFLDALALVDGERIRDIVQRSTALPRGLTAGPSREDAETRLFADLDPATSAWVLARYTLYPIGTELLDAAMGGDGDLVSSCGEPRRGASAPDRRAAQGKVVRARHRPLSDAQHAGGADWAAYCRGLTRSLQLIGDFVEAGPWSTPRPSRRPARRTYRSSARGTAHGLFGGIDLMTLHSQCWVHGA
jgi:pimeloyl-ACP methyl ester carboxylesterase